MYKSDDCCWLQQHVAAKRRSHRIAPSVLIRRLAAATRYGTQHVAATFASCVLDNFCENVLNLCLCSWILPPQQVAEILSIHSLDSPIQDYVHQKWLLDSNLLQKVICSEFVANQDAATGFATCCIRYLYKHCETKQSKRKSKTNGKSIKKVLDFPFYYLSLDIHQALSQQRFV